MERRGRVCPASSSPRFTRQGPADGRTQGQWAGKRHPWKVHSGNAAAGGQRSGLGRRWASAFASGGDPGEELPVGLRGSLEERLDTDLISVRIHTGTESQAAAKAVGARAYTTGQDIHFGAGNYDPVSFGGRYLHAHEVAHTVQQKGATEPAQAKLEVSGRGDPQELEADRFADSFMGSTTGREPPAGKSAGMDRAILRPASASQRIARAPDDAEEQTAERMQRRMNEMLAGEVDPARQGPTQLQVHSESGRHEGSTVTIDSEYLFALHTNDSDAERPGSGFLKVVRSMRFRLAGGGEATVTCTGTARFDANVIPDLTQLARAPALVASHSAEVHVTKPVAYDQHLAAEQQQGQSLASLVQGDPLLSFDSEPQQRIEALTGRFDSFAANSSHSEELAQAERRVKELLPRLREIEEARRDRREHPQDALWAAQKELGILRRLHAEIQDRHLKTKAADLLRRLKSAFEAAQTAPQRGKTASEGMEDLGELVVGAGKGAVGGLEETFNIAVDTHVYLLNKWQGLFGGEDLDVEPRSGLYKAIEDGASAGDLLAGMVDQVIEAIEEAERGNFEPLGEIIGSGLLTEGMLKLLKEFKATAMTRETRRVPAHGGNGGGHVPDADGPVELPPAKARVKKAQRTGGALDETSSMTDPAVRGTLSRRLGAKVELDPEIGSGVVVRQSDADPENIIVRVGPDAKPDHVLAQREKIEALKKQAPIKHAEQTKRIDEPVEGLYEAVDPNTTPDGWNVTDTLHSDKGKIEITTKITGPNGATGRVRRVYDPNTNTLSMEAAFFNDDLPRWISAGKPMDPVKGGTPTFAYMQMRQMRKLGIARSSLEKLHMSTIVNTRTILELGKARKAGVPLDRAVLKTHSVQYAETAMVQSGHKVRRAKVTGGDEIEVREVLSREAGDDAANIKKANDELLAEYGLERSDSVLWGFDIDVELMPWK